MFDFSVMMEVTGYACAAGFSAGGLMAVVSWLCRYISGAAFETTDLPGE